ncbi:MAG TPA: hypothetical protein VLT90_13165 [Terriglobales bacterium]|nr:hypothetical protein [Terriglobales bacterium]
MAGMEGLGRLFNVVPIAAGRGLNLQHASAITFICTGNDTFTVTVAQGFAGSYATPGNIITNTYTNTATNGSAAWVKTTQAASNAVVIASGSVAFTIRGESLPDTKNYVKVSVGASGLVMAILHDLEIQRTPANLVIPSA